MPTPAPTPPSPDSSARFCPRCHKPIPPGAAHGLCPACLLAAGFFTQAAPGDPAASDAPPPSPAELAAEFPALEIIELLGQGGMGAVYKARQRHLDRLVALKLLRPGLDVDPTFADRFTREARALAQLNHPGIVTLHEFGTTPGGRFFILMEFVDGVNLRQLLAAGRLSPREALAIVPPLCDALQYAHDRGLVHRDIKPENILVDRLGRVKIADFGLAKLAASESGTTRGTGVPPVIPNSSQGCPAPASDPTGETPVPLQASAPADLTETHRVLGTPRYMAPEQREHPAAVDHRADIYALGVVLYQMLTGELPDEKQLQPPSRRVQIDVRLDEIVLRALEKNPALRYAAASEFKTRLETVASDSPAPGSATVPAPSPAAAGFIGFEYKSRRTLFGLPLLHIANGLDSTTGRVRVARGVVAIGGIAQGVFAFGGVAVGVFAFGGVSLGLIGYGGVALGLLSMGGLGLAALACYAGLAIAPLAAGGLAIGWYAYGGQGYGQHVASSMRHDAAAEAFLGPWFRAHSGHLELANMSLLILGFVITFGVPGLLRHRLARLARFSAPSALPAWLGFIALYLAHLALLLSTAGNLPLRVASHFNGDGHADGWMPRGDYLLFSALFPLALGLFLALLAWSLRVLPASLINLPHRDHWLAPENKAATATLFARWMAGPACLLIVFFAQLDYLVVLANTSAAPRLPGGPMIAITIGFLVALMIWIVGLVLRFAEPAAPPAKLRRQHAILFVAALLALAVPAAPLIGEWRDRPATLDHRQATAAAPTPPPAPVSAEARLSEISASITFLTLPAGPTNTIPIDPAQLAALPGADVLAAPRVTTTSGNECEISMQKAADTRADDSSPTAPSGIVVRLRPVLEGELVRFSAKFTIVARDPANPAHTTSEDLTVTGEGRPDTSLLYPLSPGPDQRPRAVILHFSLPAATPPETLPQPGNSPATLATKATLDWLQSVDAGRYAESWRAASPRFRSAVTEKDWIAKLTSVRAPLLEVSSRRLDSIQETARLSGGSARVGSPWSVVLFFTRFADGQTMMETVTLEPGADGSARVAGYLIRPRTEEENTVATEARAWLAGIDAGRYADSRELAAASFRGAVSADQWLASLESVRRPLGEQKFRLMDTAHTTPESTNPPAARQVIMTFNTVFEQAPNARETVTFEREADGRWRASGYFIR